MTKYKGNGASGAIGTTESKETKETKEEPTDPKERLGSKKMAFDYAPMSLFLSAFRCFKFGADKYGKKNWIHIDKKHKASTYMNASFRHGILFLAGEDKAVDSKLCHIEHMISGLSVLKDSMLLGTFEDDRVKYPPEAIEKLREALEGIFPDDDN